MLLAIQTGLESTKLKKFVPLKSPARGRGAGRVEEAATEDKNGADMSVGTKMGHGVNWRAQLEDFYALHNPSQVQNVPAILSVYKGREAPLFAVLAKRYGAEVIAGTTTRGSSAMSDLVLEDVSEDGSTRVSGLSARARTRVPLSHYISH